MEPSAATYGPGLYVESDASPVMRAQQLAESLPGRLCTNFAEADRLLEDLTNLPPLDADALRLLGTLAERVRAAERIVQGTVERAAEAVGERLAEAGTGMAVHPAAVRERATAVLTARELAAAAEERLQVAQSEADQVAAAAAAAQAAGPDPASFAPAAVAEPAPVPSVKRRLFGLRRARDEPDDTAESTSLLQQMAAATDEAFGQRRAASAREDALLLLRAQRDRAMEEVRVAERAWRSLAGDDPVEDVEAVVRRFDPQHQDALIVAQETVGVRAVTTLLAKARDRWHEAWRTLGYEAPAVEPPEMADVVARGATAVVLTGEAIDRAEAIALAAPAAPVVAVEAVGVS